MALLGLALAVPAHAGDPPPKKPWLGVQMRLRKDKKPPVLASHVMRSSPADAAGLRDGDALAKLDGKAMDTPDMVSQLVAGKKPGDTVEIVFDRGGTEKKTTATLEVFPGADEVVRRDKIGTFAPAIVGEVLQGEVSAFKGKVTVVEFWASWCQPCKAMTPILNEIFDKKSSQGVRVVGVTSEHPNLAQKGITSFGMKFSVVSDKDDKTEPAYGPPALPTTYVIDKKGKVREVLVGFAFDEAAQLNRIVDKLVEEKDE